ncbi:NAD(P)-binding protein [Myriangium duriaei CBS 260.36]|uniref:NAD(P)-binding protein n=1 Tax=Myriangium duriaei CBS 260.36 TaxID=1168546 RepID=A0A9P4J246_9PEZI|nr:NAD(P)-binding protein [Myriangium duriaei CBS 260.36]
MAQSKTIILTGASRGIGLAIAHFLLKRQHNLVVVARSQGPLDELQRQYDGQVKVLAGDLADFSLGAKALDLATNAFGGLDGVVLNHGILDPVARVADTKVGDWQTAFNINYFSCVAIIQTCLPALRQSKGKIILTSSGAAQSTYSTWGAYGATKAALNHLAATLATEEPDITTVSVRPGVVDTDMQKAIREQHASVMDKHNADNFLNLKATGKLLRPEQPGHVMAQLALEAPKELSGAFITWNDEKLKEFQES